MSTVGFSIHDSVISPFECERLVASLAGTVRSRAGARHLMRHPAVKTIAGDPRLVELAREWVGPDAVPYRATLFDKSVSSNWLVTWHQDTALPLSVRSNDPRWGSWSTKAGIIYAQAPAPELERIVALRLHLDPSTRANGPLRVVPGSHLHGVLSNEAVRDLVAAKPSTECLSDIGGIVRMRPLIVHASSKAANEARRRVLHIEYAPSLHTLDGLPLAIA
jgi:ectoine hydroxylase-related dioxygenase (phytanoyl-CoA dioxygenase family)